MIKNITLDFCFWVFAAKPIPATSLLYLLTDCIYVNLLDPSVTHAMSLVCWWWHIWCHTSLLLSPHNPHLNNAPVLPPSSNPAPFLAYPISVDKMGVILATLTQLTDPTSCNVCPLPYLLFTADHGIKNPSMAWAPQSWRAVSET